eukprot:gene2977-4227_t
MSAPRQPRRLPSRVAFFGDTMNLKFKRVAVAVALAAAGASTVAFAADPIKIGMSGPFTGGSSSMGVSMRDGVRL